LINALESGNHTEKSAPWGWATRALLAYRSDDAESAVEYVAKSEDNNPTDFSHAMNLAVLAMAQHELDHPDEAAAALAEASQLITRLRENPNNQGHHDLQIAEIRCSAKPQRRLMVRQDRIRNSPLTLRKWFEGIFVSFVG
jgi:hypothetical protein